MKGNIQNRLLPISYTEIGFFVFKMKKVISLFIILCFICLGSARAIFAENKPLKIISLTPATTEILFALGLDDEIIGVTTFCSYPFKAKNKKKVGTFSQPDFEKIIYLKPDIVFATGLEQAYAVDRLRQLGLNVFVSYPANIEELFRSINNIGSLTDRVKEAKNLIAEMNLEINKIKKLTQSIPENDKPRVFIEIWYDPLMSAGEDSLVNELINIAGGINIASDAPRAYSYFSAEQVIKRDPDCIILGHSFDGDARELIKSRLGFSEIKAVRNNRVYADINTDLFLRPGPRVVEGIEEIYKRLYLR